MAQVLQNLQEQSYKYSLLYSILIKYQYQMSKLHSEQIFLLPETSQALPTFRQIGNDLNSIPSASTIFLQRDNTHTRLQSQLKITSNKPSLDLQSNIYTHQKNESDILSYSQTSSLIIFQDSLINLQRLINLMVSKDHLYNHISNSLALSGFNLESKSIAKLIGQSFCSYSSMASKVDFKLIREELNGNINKIAKLNKDIVGHKQQNLLLYEKVIKLQKQNAKYRKKISSLKQQLKFPTNHMTMINSFKEKYNILINRFVLFESQILQKFGIFQNSLIKVTTLRNKLIKNHHGFERNKSKQHEKQNKTFRLSRQTSTHLIERYPMKQIDQNSESNISEIEYFKQIVKQKNDEVIKLNSMVENLSIQLETQKNLYEQILDKNISLQKQIFMISTKKGHPSSDSSESFCIIDQDYEMKYFNEEEAENNYIKIGQ